MYNYILKQRINNKAIQVCRLRERLDKEELELHRLMSLQQEDNNFVSV